MQAEHELRRRPIGVGTSNWIDPPQNRWAFRHVREMARTAVIRRGDDVRVLPVETVSIDAIEFEFEGRTSNVTEMLANTYTDAFVVVHDGAIVAEHYLDGMTHADTHLLMSVSKSLTATLAGVVVGRGLLRPDMLVTDCIASLAGTSWEGCTVQHLLDMRAGTDFDEDDYSDPDSPGRLIEEVSDYVPRTRTDLPPDTAAWIATLGNVRAHGDRFQYRSILTDVLAWVIESVTGERFADVFSSEIWSRIGPEGDAEIIVDNAGFPLAEGGICTTARDLARFGLMMLEGGTVDGVEIVPKAWLQRLRVYDEEAIAAYSAYAVPTDPVACYRDMWWVSDAVAGLYAGSGVNGQMLRIDHTSNTVIVKLSSWPDRWDDRMSAWAEAGVAAVADALRS